MQSQALVIFSVECSRTKPGEAVFVVGGHEELGEWNPGRALPLYTTEAAYPVWSSKPIAVEAGVELEYKFVVQQENRAGTVRWEEITGNRRVRAGEVCASDEDGGTPRADLACAATTAMSVWGNRGKDKNTSPMTASTTTTDSSRSCSEDFECPSPSMPLDSPLEKTVNYYQDMLKQAFENEQLATEKLKQEQALRQNEQQYAWKLFVQLEQERARSGELVRRAEAAEREATWLKGKYESKIQMDLNDMLMRSASYSSVPPKRDTSLDLPCCETYDLDCEASDLDCETDDP